MTPSAEQLEGVVLLDVLREHDHPGVRVLGADPLRRLDALVGVRRGHPDVGEHGVGLVLDHGLEQRVRIGGGADELEVVGLGEQGGHALTDEVVVVREHDPQRHDRDCNRVGASRPVLRRPGSGERVRGEGAAG